MDSLGNVDEEVLNISLYSLALAIRVGEEDMDVAIARAMAALKDRLVQEIWDQDDNAAIEAADAAE